MPHAIWSDSWKCKDNVFAIGSENRQVTARIYLIGNALLPDLPGIVGRTNRQTRV